MGASERGLFYVLEDSGVAAQALEEGHDPFGSLLVDEHGTVLAEDRNRVGDGDQTLHPEIALARWAAAHLDAPGRAASTVYTSGEHCPMCSAAHALRCAGCASHEAGLAPENVPDER